MKTDIFIVSCAKHFPYLKYCLRSIQKFATGFHHAVLLIPKQDIEAAYNIAEANKIQQLSVVPFAEWPDKGMLHHEYLEMVAPGYCRHTDAILHLDSDMIFTEPVTPADYTEDGKPVMVHATFDWLMQHQANLEAWKHAVEDAIGRKCERETMRRPGLIHIPPVYAKAQELIEAHNDMPMQDYIRKQRNEFPQTFAEYPTLGWVAWEFFHDRYKWIDQETDPFPPMKIQQFWGHGPIDRPQTIWVKGRQVSVTPLDLIREKGLA